MGTACCQSYQSNNNNNKLSSQQTFEIVITDRNLEFKTNNIKPQSSLSYFTQTESKLKVQESQKPQIQIPQFYQESQDDEIKDNSQIVAGMLQQSDSPFQAFFEENEEEDSLQKQFDKVQVKESIELLLKKKSKKLSRVQTEIQSKFALFEKQMSKNFTMNNKNDNQSESQISFHSQLDNMLDVSNVSCIRPRSHSAQCVVKGILKKQLKYTKPQQKSSSNSSLKKVSFQLDERVLRILQRHEKKQKKRKSVSKKNQTQKQVIQEAEIDKNLIYQTTLNKYKKKDTKSLGKVSTSRTTVKSPNRQK